MAIKEDKPFQDIFTPRALVDELMSHCVIKDGDTVFEPSVGSGNLIIPILEKYDVNVVAVEIQQKHIDTFVERLYDMGIDDITFEKSKSLQDINTSFEDFF